MATQVLDQFATYGGWKIREWKPKPDYQTAFGDLFATGGSLLIGVVQDPVNGDTCSLAWVDGKLQWNAISGLVLCDDPRADPQSWLEALRQLRGVACRVELSLPKVLAGALVLDIHTADADSIGDGNVGHLVAEVNPPLEDWSPAQQKLWPRWKAALPR